MEAGHATHDSHGTAPQPGGSPFERAHDQPGAEAPGAGAAAAGAGAPGAGAGGAAGGGAGDAGPLMSHWSEPGHKAPPAAIHGAPVQARAAAPAGCADRSSAWDFDTSWRSLGPVQQRAAAGPAAP